MENHKCEACNKAFETKSIFCKHVCYVNIQDKVNYKKKNLECNVCKKRFMRRKKLNEHMKCVHQGLKKYVCSTCNRAFDKSCNLKAHTNIVHLKLQPHKCDICGRNFSVKRNLTVHLQHAHSEVKKFECINCGNLFKTNLLLKHHFKKQKVCKQKLEEESSKSVISNKIKPDIESSENHTDTGGEIIQTEKVKEEKQNLPDQNHVPDMVADVKPYFVKAKTSKNSCKCNMCRKTFRTIDVLEAHIKNDHDESKHMSCKMCQKVIKDKKIHLLSCAKLKLLPVSISLSLSSDKDSSTHDQNETISNLKIIQDSKINPIDENGTLYDETENLEDQNEGKEINSLILKKEESIQNISQQAVSYEMPIAPITLQDKVIVKSEQMISGQIVPPKTELEIPNVKFQCDVCKMGFVHKFNLDAHIKADHQNIHSYKCDQCPNSFRGEYQLGRHKKNVHSGKKYECDICKRKFSARRDRNDHVKQVHEGLKNSICHICNKAFSTNKNMKVHVKVVHHQVREHVCDICKKSFKVQCTL